MRRVLVLPAASGKSTMIRTGLPSNVREADDVCHHTETLELAALRESGKLTGNWTPYDKLYGSILISRTQSDTIILIASTELAVQSGLIVIGRFLLEYGLWCENVIRRGQTIGKYVSNYMAEKDENHVLCNSREELYLAVKKTCESV
ncbi:putative nucleocapsid [Plasmopara viticola lesion associated mononegaambi virus 6]|uniref:Putative nucleocapsid n=1 Tax=Plasmopara viticola lesion associated mononegaambi virus 6 TaxID=2692018 RepID=A0A6B9Q501_9MONO|nr:putative nucleocapsid [Plasmopara viticola lesion associated mononegaambi virus 6]QHD64778.1 putative nucleocapsid [Plasmopara viticola lesion associated mononegaambi virus 6]